MKNDLVHIAHTYENQLWKEGIIFGLLKKHDGLTVTLEAVRKVFVDDLKLKE
jgi:hypothetical protein